MTRHRIAFTVAIIIVAGLLSFFNRNSPEILDQPKNDPTSDLTGQVLTVADGDTITLRVDGDRVKVRIQGIDCPERDQPFGKEAGDFVKDLVLNREVEVKSLGKDQYDRVLGEVSIDGKNLNKELLKNGYAWWYERHARDRTDYRDLQEEAREANRGLWSDPEAIPPWEFRRNRSNNR